jgi:hypothetical protein
MDTIAQRTNKLLDQMPFHAEKRKKNQKLGRGKPPKLSIAITITSFKFINGKPEIVHARTFDFRREAADYTLEQTIKGFCIFSTIKS